MVDRVANTMLRLSIDEGVASYSRTNRSKSTNSIVKGHDGGPVVGKHAGQFHTVLADLAGRCDDDGEELLTVLTGKAPVHLPLLVDTVLHCPLICCRRHSDVEDTWPGEEALRVVVREVDVGALAADGL